MRGASTLIPARFLAIVAHLCVMITLLWETKLSVNLCLPSQYHQNLHQQYHNRLLGGYAAAVALLLLELTTFLLGLTMFSPSISLLSIGTHGGASILLTYFILDGWLCDWYWPIFALCSALPALCDTSSASGVDHSHSSEVYTDNLTEKYMFDGPNEQQLLTPGHDGWTLYLVLVGLATTLGCALPVGYSIGVVNTPAAIIKEFCNASIKTRYDVDISEGSLEVLWSSIVSIFIIGGCTGSVLGATLANTMGRKGATILTSIISLVGALNFLLCRTANSVEMLLLGRLLVGLAAGLTTSIVPMWVSEVSPAGRAAACAALCPLGVNAGVLAGQLAGLPYLLGGVNNWPYLLSVFAVLVIICLPIMVILPESPKFLFVVKGDEDRALKELSRLRGVSRCHLSRDISELRAEKGREGVAARGGRSMGAVLRDPALRLPLLLAVAGQAGQQTSGINAVFYYSQTIFEHTGLSQTNAQYATIGCGFINVCTCVIMVWLLPRVGRRPLMLSSTLSAAVLLYCLALSMLFMDVVSWMPFVCMVMLLSYVLVYGFGLGPIPYFIASELFEVGARPSGMAWGSLANWGGNFLVGMSFPTLRQYIGAYCFIIFASITTVVYVFLRFYFPETKGQTPAYVAKLCSRGFKSRPLQPLPDDTV